MKNTIVKIACFASVAMALTDMPAIRYWTRVRNLRHLFSLARTNFPTLLSPPARGRLIIPRPQEDRCEM